MKKNRRWNYLEYYEMEKADCDITGGREEYARQEVVREQRVRRKGMKEDGREGIIVSLYHSAARYIPLPSPTTPPPLSLSLSLCLLFLYSILYRHILEFNHTYNSLSALTPFIPLLFFLSSSSSITRPSRIKAFPSPSHLSM